jgi:hypothetical protein
VNQSKISVFMGNDNPYAALWTLIGAKLFSRPDGTVLDRTVQGTSPLIGFNWSNSVNPVLGAQDKCNATMEITRINGIRAQIQRDLGFEDVVRFEHLFTETYKHIVRQPYDRLEELVEIADHVANISAKHEGAPPEIDSKREHPSDILDYFRDKSEIEEAGQMHFMLRNYLDKHDSVNRTARALTENGLTFIAAQNLHRR